MTPSETTPCTICGLPIPHGAHFCTECNHWQARPGLVRFLAITGRTVGLVTTVLAGVGIPVLLFFAAHAYERAETERSRADVSAQREAQVFQTLSKALQSTISITHRFREGSLEVAAACSPGPSSVESEDHVALCKAAFMDAVAKLDGVVTDLSWAVDMAPIPADTYARTSNLKYEYFRPCANDVAPEKCGLRQRLLRALHGNKAHGPHVALKFCRQRSDDPERRLKCDEAREAMKSDVVRTMRAQITNVLCSITRDANELRIRTWTAAADTGALAYQQLAERLRALTEHSDCARRLRQDPIPSDCPYGKDMSGTCLSSSPVAAK